MCLYKGTLPDVRHRTGKVSRFMSLTWESCEAPPMLLSTLPCVPFSCWCFGLSGLWWWRAVFVPSSLVGNLCEAVQAGVGVLCCCLLLLVPRKPVKSGELHWWWSPLSCFCSRLVDLSNLLYRRYCCPVVTLRVSYASLEFGLVVAVILLMTVYYPQFCRWLEAVPKVWYQSAFI